MVVDQLDILCTTVLPHEADPPLVVDPDAVLPLAVTLELLETVTRWDSEIFDVRRSVEQLQLSECLALKDLVEGLDVLLAPDALGVLVPERPDRTSRV